MLRLSLNRCLGSGFNGCLNLIVDNYRLCISVRLLIQLVIDLFNRLKSKHLMEVVRRYPVFQLPYFYRCYLLIYLYYLLISLFVSFFFHQSYNKGICQCNNLFIQLDKDSLYIQLFTKGHKLLSLKVIECVSYPASKILLEEFLEVSISFIIYFVGVGFYGSVFLYILLCDLFILKLNPIILLLYLLLPVCCFVCHYVCVYVWFM